MALPSIVEDITQRLRRSLESPASDDIQQNTAGLLYSLLQKDVWLQDEMEVIGQISRRLDITRKLHAFYDDNWKKSGESLLQEPWYSLVVILLYRAYLKDRDEGAQHSSLLRRFNAIFKALEHTEQEWINSSSELRHKINSDFQNLAINQKPDGFNIDITTPVTVRHDQSKEVILPITVLFYEGPIARAYLEAIRQAGYRPRTIIQLISSIDIADKKPVGRFLPSALRQTYAASIQKRKIHYWPKQIAATYPELYKAIASQVADCLDFPIQAINEACSLSPLSDYCDDVVPLFVTGLRDKHLHEHLSSCAPTTILFTGGGIVPASLLGIEKLKFIHIHPGYLPYIRGADCVLWSALLTGQTSATSFYMSPGIDTGDIIKACWLPEVRFDANVNMYDIKTLYRAIYSFFDPWVRSYVLRETIHEHDNFSKISTVKQTESEGSMYYFMHPEMQKSALRFFFPGNRDRNDL